MADSETLFDITDIPYFPYSPGVMAWVAFLSLSALILAGLFYMARRKNSKFRELAVTICQNEIEKLSLRIRENPQHSKEVLYRASLLTRRLISSSEEDISNLSANELENFKQRSSNPALKELVESLIRVESDKYRPQSDAQITLAYLENILRRLDDYRNYRIQNIT